MKDQKNNQRNFTFKWRNSSNDHTQLKIGDEGKKAYIRETMFRFGLCYAEENDKWLMMI
jgi:hypothetical protein